MWLPKTLILQNFISHLNTTFTFESGKAVMIQGINLDDDCQESNGSGKSGIIEGTCFVLTGESFRKVKAVDLIMNDCATADTAIIMYNTISKQTMLISRTLDRKSGSTVLIEIDGVQKVLSSVNAYDKFILDELDISKDDLMNYFIVSKEKYQSFLLAGDVKKKEIIARFSNSNLIDGIEKLVDTDVQDFVNKATQFENTKSRIEGQISVYNDQINNEGTENDFEADKKIKVSEYELQIKALDKQIIELNKTIKGHAQILSKAQEKLKTFSFDEFNKKMLSVENDEAQVLKIVEALKANVSEYEELIAKMKKNLAGSVTCPKCKHEFVATEPDFDVVKGKEILPLLENELKDVKLDIETQRKKQKIIEQAKNDIKSEIRKLENLQHEVKLEIRKTENDVENCNRSIQSFEKQKIGINQSIEKIKSMKFESNITKTKEKLKDAESELKFIEKQINKNNEDKQLLTEWIYIFKKFKTHLTNQSVKVIESFTNMYLTKIKTNLAVKMEGFKLLADGKTVRENISIDLLRNGIAEGAFGKFSSGEKVRVDICNILALQKLINLNSKSGGFDLLLLDEIVESVDSVGVAEILRQLNSINQTISIITHANTIKDYEHTVIIKKEHGYSSII